MATCPNCGNQTGEGAVFCDQCGTRIPAPEAAVPEPAAAPAPAGGSVICPACGAGNVPGEAFCDYCGSPLDAPLPDEAEAPAPVSEEAAPAVEEAAPPAADQDEPAAADALICPICSAEVQPDEAFCANCGASLAQAPIPPEPVPEAEPAPESEAAPELEEAPEPEEAAPEPGAAAAPEAAAPEPEEAAPEAEAAAPAPEAPPPAPEPAVEEAPAPPAEPVSATCPACGAEVEAGDVFCSACGFSLKAPPAPAPDVVTPAPAAAPAPAVAGPRLVVPASGAEIPLPAKEEIIVGREDPVSGIYPDVDLTPHGGESGGVSRRHARILVEGGEYYVEDLDSTNFTFVNKQKLTPKTRQVVHQDDEIRFGRVAVVLKTA
ncbi:MAG: zinc-ribbon domain-containing protein [Anaerolineae bacterium]|jgi:predicted amidophosphoribosyltransferase